MPDLLSLPNEILIPQILALLDWPDLRSIALTCQTLNNAYKSPYLHNLLRQQAASALKHTLCRRPSFHTFSLSGSPMRGLALPERISRGQYIHTISSNIAYYRAMAVARAMLCSSLSRHLHRRVTLMALQDRNILDVQEVRASPRLAASMRALKVAFRQRDFKRKWHAVNDLESVLKCSLGESSRLREYLCFGHVKKAISIWERLASGN